MRDIPIKDLLKAGHLLAWYFSFLSLNYSTALIWNYLILPTLNARIENNWTGICFRRRLTISPAPFFCSNSSRPHLLRPVTSPRDFLGPTWDRKNKYERRTHQWHTQSRALIILVLLFTVPQLLHLLYLDLPNPANTKRPHTKWLNKYPLESEIAELIRPLLFPFNHATLIQDSG